MRLFDESDPRVRFKLDLLKRAMPAKSAVVFGDMYRVEGAYTEQCLDLGCERALLIDSFETVGWLERRKSYPTIEFYKGDFSNPLFMKSFTSTYDLGVAFDILLHQPPLLGTLHLMIEKVRDKLCIAQPVLREQAYPNTLIYLPGNPNDADLYPLPSRDANHHMFDVEKNNQSHWIWAMTPSFLISALKGEGFEVIYQDEVKDSVPNPNWTWWGCIAERKKHNPWHWENMATYGLLHPGEW